MTDYEKLLIMIYNDPLYKADAIVLLEGDGFARLSHAAELYKKKYAPVLVFSGEITDYSYGSYPFQECKPLLIEMGVSEKDIIHENRSTQTAEQAYYISLMIREKKWSKVILVASPHHQCRAYLTFLRQLPPNVVLMNSPAANLSWFEEEDWGCRFDLLDQEQKRIENYTLKGDLISIKEAIEYQKWKETYLTEMHGK